jgi:signal recognition particle subunit SRP54
MEEARKRVVDVVIVDTAGRLAIDEELMTEVAEVRKALDPYATIFVADSMTGQDAVNVAQAFHAKTPLTGVVLTKLDGDARGGAALSIKFLTGLPILFMGMGEGVGALEPFHPTRLASRILDMGDVLTLVEKAQEAISEEEARESVGKMSKGEFTLEDFLGQMKMMKKLGSMEGILKMLPGGNQMMSQLQGVDAEGEMKKTEAIILSMTKKERRNHKILNGQRRIRIAKGSGTQVQDVNRLVSKFEDAQRMMSQFAKMGLFKKMMGMGPKP